MGGTIHGRIECHDNDAATLDRLQDIYVSLYRFLNLRKTRLVLQYGSAATGMDYHDGANPAKDNSFAVFKFPASALRPTWSWYLMIQGCFAAANFGGAPGNPGLFWGMSGARGVGVQAATASTLAGGDWFPWNGTTANDGTDTKGSTVWAGHPSGGKLYVFPRSNNPGGSYTSSKHDCGPLGQNNGGANPERWHIFCDDDSFAMYWAPNSATAQYRWAYVGPYTPAPGVTVERPLVMLLNGSIGSNMIWPTTWGPSDAGVAEDFSDTGGGVKNFRVDYYSACSTPNHNPNPQFLTTTYSEFKLPLITFEYPYMSLIGWIDSPLMRWVWNLAVNHDQNAAKTKTFLSWTATRPNSGWTVPWDGVTVAGSGAGMARDGVDF